ncbi:MAG: hypothetical protein BroJett040_01410 [Oligoflexia bacterium]|nr:MAG: hypothetical protein BroJett040_01410 [Oligoflexia bacterium]
MSVSDFAIAVCQMNSIDDVETNYRQIVSLLDQISKSQSVQMACFPENCLYLRTLEGEKVQGLHLVDKVFHQLATQAKERGIFLHLGASPIREHGKLYNASVLIAPTGEVRMSYQKIHLFNIELEGQAPIRESDVYTYGEKPEILEIHGWHIGQTICYDLRFAELFNYYAQHLVDLILVPASFLVPTGKAHWEVLLRARAIESQAYVVAAAQAGTHNGVKGGKRETYGHSLVVDPWGQIVAEAKTMGPEVMILSLSHQRIQDVRRQIPMRYHRRLVQMKR